MFCTTPFATNSTGPSLFCLNFPAFPSYMHNICQRLFLHPIPPEQMCLWLYCWAVFYFAWSDEPNRRVRWLQTNNSNLFRKRKFIVFRCEIYPAVWKQQATSHKKCSQLSCLPQSVHGEIDRKRRHIWVRRVLRLRRLSTLKQVSRGSLFSSMQHEENWDLERHRAPCILFGLTAACRLDCREVACSAPEWFCPSGWTLGCILCIDHANMYCLFLFQNDLSFCLHFSQNEKRTPVQHMNILTTTCIR